MTLGESRVRISFNPSSSDKVTEIKIAAALLINLVNDLQLPEKAKPVDGVLSVEANEFFRLKALAMTEAESAAMWAVKAATI